MGTTAAWPSSMPLSGDVLHRRCYTAQAMPSVAMGAGGLCRRRIPQQIYPIVINKQGCQQQGGSLLQNMKTPIYKQLMLMLGGAWHPVAYRAIDAYVGGACHPVAYIWVWAEPPPKKNLQKTLKAFKLKI
jgi:hypothetical protein